MAGVKDIFNKIKSITNTQKITKAMEMVAFSNIRKTEKKMKSGRPYSKVICRVIQHLTEANLEYNHPFLNERKIKKVGFIIVSTDRGLCGSLNTNLFKKILISMKEYTDREIISNLAIIGLKGNSFFQSFHQNIIFKAVNLTNIFQSVNLKNLIQIVLDAYYSCAIDKLFIAYNHFNNKLFYTPLINQLLPLPKSIAKEKHKKTWDYLYEPDAKTLLDKLLYRYIESQIYQGILENSASEQAARMVAMKKATDNSANIIKGLQLLYNKARQDSITQELIEIISGASAVSFD